TIARKVRSALRQAATTPATATPVASTTSTAALTIASTTTSTVSRTTNLLRRACRAAFKSKSKADNNDKPSCTIYELQRAFAEERAARYVAEATLDEAEGALSELRMEYASQYAACFVAESNRAETDAVNSALRADIDALYAQLGESRGETIEIRRDTWARLEETEAFRALEEAGRIAAESACASMGVAVTNLESALSAPDATHTESMAALAEANHNAEREAEAARSEALELHAKLADTSRAASQLAAKSAIDQQQLADVNGQLDAAKQTNELLQDRVQELQRGAKKHVLDLDKIHSELLCLRKAVANYRVAAAGGHQMCIYCGTTLGAGTASELARR
ncbi:hypothetical protein LPJ66_006617, partial [Kickxella alabastrina]